MSVKFESAVITPNEVRTGQQFLISVKVQASTYQRLRTWIHEKLKKFTHKNLAEDLLK